MYPGIPELLQQLADRGARLAVVTSKVECYARQIVHAAPWGHDFTAVYGVSEASAHSEKAAQIARALRDFAVPATHAVMLGDRHYDIEGARACGVRTVSALWGYGTHAELAQAGADALVESPATLAQWASLGVSPALREDSRA